MKATTTQTHTSAATLEMILSTICKDRTPTQTANKLLAAFGSLKGVFEARPEALRTVTSKANADKIAALLPIARAVIGAEAEELEQISNRASLEAYCKTLLMGKRTEEFYVICVNAQCKLVGSRRIATGSLSEVSAYPRLVMETALNYNAHSVFLAHNHPGGTCSPSAEDIASTRQLDRMLSTVGIKVLDHMIIAGANGYSLRQHGDF